MTYALRQLSVSQVEAFDPKQRGGCPRRWWFEFPQGLKPPRTDAKNDGDKGHELLAAYFKSGNPPAGRVKMGTAVRGVIAKGALPAPGSDLLVERRFSGQPQRDAEGKWVPLDPALTPIRIGGIPWDGFIDLMFRRDDRVGVLDHKFSAGIHAEWSKRAHQLIHTVQMPVYALVGLFLYPDATQFLLGHNNVSRTGVDSDLRSAVVTLDQVREREADIATVVEQMKSVAPATSQEDVPFNRKSCSTWLGCPHQSRCTAFKERKVNLSAEEMALFDSLDEVAQTEAPPVAEVKSPIPQTTPANDPGLPPPVPGKAPKMVFIDVPAGAIEVRACEVGQEYVVDGKPAVFKGFSPCNGKSLAAFQTTDGGLPILKEPADFVVPVAPPAPAQAAPAPTESKRRTSKKAEEKPAPAAHAATAAAPVKEGIPASECKDGEVYVVEGKLAEFGGTSKGFAFFTVGDTPLRVPADTRVSPALTKPTPVAPVITAPAAIAPATAQLPPPDSSPSLGDRVKDFITGFAGIVTGRVDYLTGCAQFLVQPPVKDGGDLTDARWFDETRVVVVDRNAVVLPPRTNNGPDQAAPVK